MQQEVGERTARNQLLLQGLQLREESQDHQDHAGAMEAGGTTYLWSMEDIAMMAETN